MATTLENLKDAFAGESQANQKYRAFAKKAETEGLPNIARLFRTAAEAERIHAEGHLKSMDGVGTSVENLQEAIGGETYEFSSMYPPMIAQAEAEGHKGKRMFEYALKAEASPRAVVQAGSGGRAAGQGPLRKRDLSVPRVRPH